MVGQKDTERQLPNSHCMIHLILGITMTLCNIKYYVTTPLHYRDMGGTLTPALGSTLTEQPDFPVDPPGNIHSDDQELDLMYDPQLNCFYDPVTNKYYELVQ